jgi:cellulase/cellobiase CelA1
MVRFTVTSHWDSGYRAEVTIVNTTAVTIDGWKLEFRAPGAVLQLPADNAQATVSGDQITAENASWNGTLAPGGSAVLGFMFNGHLQDPEGCVLDGSPCTFVR